MMSLGLEEAWKGRDACTMGVCVWAYAMRTVQLQDHCLRQRHVGGYTGRCCPESHFLESKKGEAV